MPGTLLHVLNALILLRPPLHPLGNGVQRNNEPARWQPGKQWGQGVDPPSVPEPGLVTAPTEQASPPHLCTPHTRASITSPAAAQHGLTPTGCWAGRAACEHPPTPSSVRSGNRKVKQGGSFQASTPWGNQPAGASTGGSGAQTGGHGPGHTSNRAQPHGRVDHRADPTSNHRVSLEARLSFCAKENSTLTSLPSSAPPHSLSHSLNEFFCWFGSVWRVILLRYSARTVKLTPLKCSTQRASIFTGLGNHHHDLIPERFHRPRQTLTSLAVTPHSPCPSQPPVATRLRPAPMDVPVWTSHLSGITGHVVFRVWLLSLSTMFPRVTVS